MSLELAIQNETAIMLPGGLAASPLTLAEIGAITCVACLAKPQEDEEGIAARMQSPEMMGAVKSLAERGIFQVATEGRAVTPKLNLDVIVL